jgi:hypothetical protein
VSDLRAHRRLALALLIVTFVMVASHPLELWGKLRLNGPTWLAVHHNLYVAFGPVAAVTEPGALIALGTLAWRERRRGWRWAPSALAAAAVALGLAVWASFTHPANQALNAWTAATLPADWTSVRNQWEISHAVHAALVAFALTVLLSAVVRGGDTSRKDTA